VVGQGDLGTAAPPSEPKTVGAQQHSPKLQAEIPCSTTLFRNALSHNMTHLTRLTNLT